jgi:hypothetical protein
MQPGSAALLAALALAPLAAAVSPAAAQEIIYVRNHRGLQVSVQPVARTGNVIVVRETYKDKREKRGSTNAIYAYDCEAGALRYVEPSDARVMKDAEFYDGAYKKAHERLCLAYKDPHDR